MFLHYKEAPLPFSYLHAKASVSFPNLLWQTAPADMLLNAPYPQPAVGVLPCLTNFCKQPVFPAALFPFFRSVLFPVPRLRRLYAGYPADIFESALQNTLCSPALLKSERLPALPDT